MIRHYSSIIFTFHPFQPSPISMLRVVHFRSVLLLILQNYKTKLSWCVIDWQLSVPNVNWYAYSYPLPPLWRWRLNFDLNGIERVIHLSVPKNYVFESIINDYFYRYPFTIPNFTGARSAHKRHHGYIYSYHRVLNSY